MIKVMLGILGAMGFIGTITGAILWMQTSFAPNPAFQALKAEFISYQMEQRIDNLERRMTDYRISGVCIANKQVCTDLQKEIDKLKRKNKKN